MSAPTSWYWLHIALGGSLLQSGSLPPICRAAAEAYGNANLPNWQCSIPQPARNTFMTQSMADAMAARQLAKQGTA